MDERVGGNGKEREDKDNLIRDPLLRATRAHKGRRTVRLAEDETEGVIWGKIHR